MIYDRASPIQKLQLANQHISKSAHLTNQPIPMRLTIITLLLALTTPCHAQTKAALTDMSKTDITTMQDFDGAKVSFMGFHLGMSKKDALQQLKGLKDLKWRFDDFNTRSH